MGRTREVEQVVQQTTRRVERAAATGDVSGKGAFGNMSPFGPIQGRRSRQVGSVCPNVFEGGILQSCYRAA